MVGSEFDVTQAAALDRVRVNDPSVFKGITETGVGGPDTPMAVSIDASSARRIAVDTPAGGSSTPELPVVTYAMATPKTDCPEGWLPIYEYYEGRIRVDCPTFELSA